MQVREIRVQSILTRTGGFLGAGFSHTLNPYAGCSYGRALCGAPCYAQHNAWTTRGRTWGSFLDVKTNAAEAYRGQIDAERRWACARGGLRFFMSSVTDPYVPQERRYRISKALLEAMLESPPERLVVQTHTPHPLWDIELLGELGRRVPDLSVNISVETDRERLGAGFAPHATPLAARLAALARLRRSGIRCAAVVAPMLPIDDVEGFARRLGEAADRVILDHFLIGDGSPGGQRTRRTGFPERLESAGLGEWGSLDKFHQVCDVFRAVLGDGRVGISSEGFNAP